MENSEQKRDQEGSRARAGVLLGMGVQLKQRWTAVMTGKTGDSRDGNRQRQEQATWKDLG